MARAPNEKAAEAKKLDVYKRQLLYSSQPIIWRRLFPFQTE